MICDLYTGVLLLNACLTVVASQANSHKDKVRSQQLNLTAVPVHNFLCALCILRTATINN